MTPKVLLASSIALLVILAALAVMVAQPAAPVDLSRAPRTISIARTADQPWGRDVLTVRGGAKQKPAPLVGPGLPGKLPVLATQRPFAPAPATAVPPKLPDAYGGAMPARAERSR